MTARVSCSSGPACPGTGRVRAVFARTDLRYSLSRVVGCDVGHARASRQLRQERPQRDVSYGAGRQPVLQPLRLIGTDLRHRAWHRLQPVCLCLRRGGVNPARRLVVSVLPNGAKRRAFAFWFCRRSACAQSGGPFRQGTTSVHPEARTALQKRTMQTTVTNRKGTALAVPKSHAKLWALAPEAGSIFMHRRIKTHPPAAILRHAASVPEKPEPRPNFLVTRIRIA